MGYGGGDGETHATVVVGVVWFLDGRKGASEEVGQGLGGGYGGRGAGVGPCSAGTGGPLNLCGEDARHDERVTVLWASTGRGPFWERGELEELLLLSGRGVRVGIGCRAEGVGVATVAGDEGVLVPVLFLVLFFVLVLWFLGQAAVEPAEEGLHDGRERSANRRLAQRDCNELISGRRQQIIQSSRQANMFPAHQTKHLPSLAHPILGHTFHLTQSDDGHSNGTALWLGAQILSLYLPKLPVPKQRRPRAVELGSGVGLTAYVCRLCLTFAT